MQTNINGNAQGKYYVLPGASRPIRLHRAIFYDIVNSDSSPHIHVAEETFGICVK